jgi:16S rRNA (uracil1498-N3)-methyltransferase
VRVPRIFVDSTLHTGLSLTLDARAAQHVGQVLRLRPGAELVLFDGSGCDYAAVLERCDRRACQARLGERLGEEAEPALTIALGIGISRGERMDFAIQKAVELGVSGITPLQTARSVVQLDAGRMERRLQHWRGVLLGACEQSGRSRLPELETPVDLGTWLDRCDGGLVLYHRAEATLAVLPAPAGRINLLIGPEGGLDPAELAQAQAGGLVPVRLGPRVLRTETAPLAAIAAIQALWGDFR